MGKLKSSTLWRRVIIIITVLTITLTACEGNSNTETSNKYKVGVETQTDNFYVNDFANLFLEEDKQVVLENAIKLDEQYDGIQVVVTTVNNLKGNEIEEYAYSMFEQYGIGKNGMGILILLSVEDRDVRIETGKTMQIYITDSKSGQLLDKYGMDYFRENKFAEGLIAVQEAVISEIKRIVPIDWNYTEEKEETTAIEETKGNINSSENVDNNREQSTDEVQNKNGVGGVDMIFAILFIIALAVIVTLIAECRKIKAILSEASENNEQLSEKAKNLQTAIDGLKDDNLRLCKKVQELNTELEKTHLKHEETTQSMKNQYEQAYRQFNTEISSLTQKNAALDKQITETQEFYGRVRKLHPECDFEKEVEDMIETEFRATVSSVDNQINEVIDMPADKDRVEVYKNAIDTYENAQSDIREAVTADIDKVRSLYQESINLRNRAEAMDAAKKLDEKLNAVLNMMPDKDNVETFDNALNAYNVASTLIQEFVQSDIAKVRSLYQESMDLRKAFEIQQQELQDKAEAKRAFDKMNMVYSRNHKGEYDEYDDFHKAYLLYERLTNNQKKFFPDAEMLMRYEILMRKAKECKRNYEIACRAEENAQNAIRFIYNHADEDDRDKISKAFRYYNELNDEQRRYFSDELLNKMKRFKREADEDYNYQQRRREERRREERKRDEERRKNSYSNSSFHSFSSGFNSSSSSRHSGKGGHSSGGGASRHF